MRANDIALAPLGNDIVHEVRFPSFVQRRQGPNGEHIRDAIPSTEEAPPSSDESSESESEDEAIEYSKLYAGGCVLVPLDIVDEDRVLELESEAVIESKDDDDEATGYNELYDGGCGCESAG